MKKTIAFILAVILIACLTACGGKGGNAPEGVDKDSKGYFAGEDAGTLVMPDDSLDAEAIYSSIEYVPQMFYGYYGLPGTMAQGSDDSLLDNYRTEMNYVSPETFFADTESDVTVIPYVITAGPANLNHLITNIHEHEWMRIYLQSSAGNLVSVMGAYEISGRTLSFFPLSQYSYDETTNKISYRLAEESIDYEFSFLGGDMTLSKDGKSVTMRARDLDDSWEYASVQTYHTEGSERVGDVEHFDAINSPDGYSRFALRLADDTYINTGVGYFDVNGLFSFSWTDEVGNDHAYQYVYFFCGKDGLVLADETTTYFYNTSESSLLTSSLADSLSYEDMEKLANMSEDAIQKITETRSSLLSDLSNAFSQAGIAIEMDETTGEISLDSAILFGYNESELSDDGKVFIKEFLDVYSSVILSDSYDGFVSKILIEGHTDSSGDYNDNLILSQERADSVKAYCVSSECGADASLEGLLQSVGYSSDQLIYDESGSEDAEASRRVTFRFLINIE